MNYKNMKIEINEDQPLDDVVRELERLGYKRIAWWGYKSLFIVTNCEKRYTDIDYDSPNFKLTTLAELKAMTNDQTRPNRSGGTSIVCTGNYLCGSVD